MKRLMRGLLELVMLGALSGEVFGLDWENKEMRGGVNAGNGVREFGFGFVNTGKREVRILSVEGSCGCLAMEWKKEGIAAGEEGRVKVRLDTKGFWGELKRTVAVKTDEEGGRTEILTVGVELPMLVKISPKGLFWNRGEKAEGKVVEVQVFESDKLEIIGVETNGEWFSAELGKVEGRPGVYEVRVKPKGTEVGKMGLVMLKTKQAVPRGVEVSIFARVR